eukprot:GHVU01029411.1.p1 GENE.GHVU01029411.1~~GHVU01029411.1.p1  ORF type:complete len:422 (-),score=37.73 GHVU01029411.1:865-2130(-)
MIVSGLRMALGRGSSRAFFSSCFLWACLATVFLRSPCFASASSLRGAVPTTRAAAITLTGPLTQHLTRQKGGSPMEELYWPMIYRLDESTQTADNKVTVSFTTSADGIKKISYRCETDGTWKDMTSGQELKFSNTGTFVEVKAFTEAPTGSVVVSQLLFNYGGGGHTSTFTARLSCAVPTKFQHEPTLSLAIPAFDTPGASSSYGTLVTGLVYEASVVEPSTLEGQLKSANLTNSGGGDLVIDTDTAFPIKVKPDGAPAEFRLRCPFGSGTVPAHRLQLVARLVHDIEGSEVTLPDASNAYSVSCTRPKVPTPPASILLDQDLAASGSLELGAATGDFRYAAFYREWITSGRTDTDYAALRSSSKDMGPVALARHFGYTFKDLANGDGTKFSCGAGVCGGGGPSTSGSPSPSTAAPTTPCT